jgi:hypothetical protein
MVAIFAENSGNSKIAGSGKVSATYVSTKGSCPSSCNLRGNGCYAENGRTGMINFRLNKAVKKGMRPEALARAEARAIREAFDGGAIPQDGARGGRDLRLHVSGDARTVRSAKILAKVVGEWIDRGGGSVWAYTHGWETVARRHWGKTSVLASMTDPKLAKQARRRGYAPAVVVESHKSDKAYKLDGSDVTWIPCPQQTRNIACSDCRLCMNSKRLFDENMGIAFEGHGATNKLKAVLVVRDEGTKSKRRLNVVTA